MLLAMDEELAPLLPSPPIPLLVTGLGRLLGGWWSADADGLVLPAIGLYCEEKGQVKLVLKFSVTNIQQLYINSEMPSCLHAQ